MTIHSYKCVTYNMVRGW